MTVFFKNGNDTILKALVDLKKSTLRKSMVYVTKSKLQNNTLYHWRDFMTFLGENPLQNSFDIHLKPIMLKSSIAKIERNLRANAMISDIVYDKQLVNLVNDNIKKVSMWILIISGFLTFIAVLLINSSRLSITLEPIHYKTMQMVGATKAFIRKPFVMRCEAWNDWCPISNFAL
jgi:cell division transport system permease protein